jgi:hypothetical protein
MKNFKNINTILIAVLFTASAVSISSCKRKDDNPTPSTPTSTVTFSISSPTEGATFHLGDTVWIKGTAVSINQLHGYALTLTNKTTNAVVLNADDHVHGTTVTLDTFWVNNVADHSDMRLQIDAEIDHEGNKESKTINFHCHPM